MRFWTEEKEDCIGPTSLARIGSMQTPSSVPPTDNVPRRPMRRTVRYGTAAQMAYYRHSCVARRGAAITT